MEKQAPKEWSYETLKLKFSELEALVNLMANMLAKIDAESKAEKKPKAPFSELLNATDKLARSEHAIWHSTSGKETGIDRDAAYELFDNLGWSRKEALSKLCECGLLSPQGDPHNHLTKRVRTPSGLQRAVVIYNFNM